MRFGTVAFDRPVGAHRDVKELEYLSALMQTAQVSRTNGSFQPCDIAAYLHSRFGLVVDDSTIRDLVFKDLGGQTIVPEDSEGGILDLVQLVGILLIPLLVDKAAAHHDDQTEAGEAFSESAPNSPSQADKGIFSTVWKSMVEQSGTDGSFTRENLRKIFEGFDEFGVPDELMDEMITSAGGTDGSFVQALTGDLAYYNSNWKDTATTNFDKVAALTPIKNNEIPKLLDEDTLEHAKQNGDGYVSPQFTTLHRKFTAPFIDFVADNYRRTSVITGLWACGICSYISYVFGVADNGWARVSCGSMSDLGCSVVQGLAKWSETIVQLSLFGLLFIGFGSMGNSINLASNKIFAVLAVLAAMLVIYTITFHPFFGEYKNDWFDTTGNKDYIADDDFFRGELQVYDASEDPKGAFYFLSLITGALLLYLQVVELAYIAASTFGCLSPTFLRILTPSGLKSEATQQSAASWKIARMVDNAMSFHTSARSSTRFQGSLTGTSGHVQAVVKFHHEEGQTEEVGGIFWTWKRVFTGSIFAEEGIWLHSRLLACNFAHFLIVVVIIFLAALGYANREEFRFSKTESVESQASTLLENSVSSFSNCTFTALAPIFAGAGLGFQDLFDAYFSQPEGSEAEDGEVEDGALEQLFRDVEAFKRNAITNCFETAADSEVERFNGLHDLFSCVLDQSTEPGLRVQDLFLLQYEDGWGLELANELFRGCNATEELIEFIGNTTFDEVEENESLLAQGAQAINLSQSDYEISVTVGFVVSLIASGYLFLVYIPSFVSSVLRYRSGCLPSLRGHDFPSHKKSIDVVTGLFGATVWSALYTSIAFGLLALGISIFILVPKPTDVTNDVLGIIAGFISVLAVRMAVLMVMRKVFFTSFYRTGSLAGQNIFFIFLEAWNIALSVGFVIARVIKIVVLSTLFIGRLDVPFLAPGVGRVFTAELGDAYYFFFRKDLLSHEAHRHPYIESFGLLCLLKLRCGKSFGARPNACWRLLFVLALMPWLKKYRVRAFGDFEEMTTRLKAKIEEEEDEDKRVSLEEELIELKAKEKPYATRTCNLNRHGSSELKEEMDALIGRNAMLELEMKQLKKLCMLGSEGHNKHEMVEI